jgi:hypothetical protein
MRRLQLLGAVGLLVAGVTMPVTASGQWISTDPGDLQFRVDYSTRGAFSCWQSSAAIAFCSTSGNTATLTHNGVSLTLSYTGTSGTAIAKNTAATVVPFGTLNAVVTGGSTFPAELEFLPRVLIFELFLDLQAPVFQGTVVNGGAYREEPGGLHLVQQVGYEYSHFLFGTGLNPATGRGYSGYFDRIPNPLISYSGGTYALTATVGLIPEPSTYLLFGTGLLGLAAIARRTKKA